MLWWASTHCQPTSHSAAHSLPLFSRSEEKNRIRKLTGWDNTGGQLTSYSYRWNRISLGKITSNLFQTKQIWVVKNKTRTLKHIPSFHRLIFNDSLLTPLPSTLSTTGGMREPGVAINALHFVSASPSSSHYSLAPALIFPSTAVLPKNSTPGWDLHGCQFLQEVSNMGSSMGCSVDICSGPPQTAMVSAPTPGSTTTFPSFSDLGVPLLYRTFIFYQFAVFCLSLNMFSSTTQGAAELSFFQ